MQPFAFHINCSRSNSGNKISLIFTREKTQKRISETSRGKLSVQWGNFRIHTEHPAWDARFYEHNGQSTLASDGGHGVVTLAAAANQTAALAHSAPIFANAQSQNLTHGGRAITI